MKLNLKPKSLHNPNRTPKVFKPRVQNKENTLIAINSEHGEVMSKEEHKQRLYDNVEFNIDGTATCKICKKTFGGAKRNASKSARRHVETHIEGISYSCSQCGKTFKSKDTITKHKNIFH